MNMLGKLKGYRNLPEPVKASMWYTVSNVLQKGMALLAMPIFTRLMTKDQYGEYAIFMSWYNILAIATTLNLYQGSYDKGLLLYEKDERAFTSSMLGLCATLCTGVLLVYLAFRDFWIQMIDLSPVMMGAMFVLLYTAPASDFWAARERFGYRYKKYVAITLSTTILSMVLGVVGVLSTEYKAEARVYTDVGAKALFAVCLFGLLMKQGKCFYKKAYWKYGILFNIPLIPHYLSTFVLNQADRIMIDGMVGPDAAAVYSVAYTISTVMLLVTTAVNNSLVPYVYKAINGGTPEKIRGSTRLLFVLAAGLSVLTMCFAPEIIYLFAGESYGEAIWVIPPIAASVYFIFCYSMFSTIEYYYQKTIMIAVASCGCAVANIALNYVFIKLFGYYAAGYTTLACYILLTLMHFAFYRKTLQKELPAFKTLHDVPMAVLCGIAVLAVMLLMVLTYRIFWVRYGLLAAILLVVLWKRKAVLDLVKNLK